MISKKWRVRLVDWAFYFTVYSIWLVVLFLISP